MSKKPDYDTLLAERDKLLSVNKEMRFKIQELIHRGSAIFDTFYADSKEVTDEMLDEWYAILIWPPAYSLEESEELAEMREEFCKRRAKK